MGVATPTTGHHGCPHVLQAVTVVRSQVSLFALGCRRGASHGCLCHSPRCHHGIEHGHLPASPGHHHGKGHGPHPGSRACNRGIGYGSRLHSPHCCHGTAHGCHPWVVTKGRNSPVGPQAVTGAQGMDIFLHPQAPTVSQSRDLFPRLSLWDRAEMSPTPQARAQTSSWDTGLSLWEKAWATPRSPGCPPTPYCVSQGCDHAVGQATSLKQGPSTLPVHACAVPRGGANPCVIATVTGRGQGHGTQDGARIL